MLGIKYVPIMWFYTLLTSKDVNLAGEAFYISLLNVVMERSNFRSYNKVTIIRVKTGENFLTSFYPTLNF